jgi:hypothetical protein
MSWIPDVGGATWLVIAAGVFFVGGVAALLFTLRALRRLAARLARLEALANSTHMDLKTLIREGNRFEEDRRATLDTIALVKERQEMLELRASGGLAYEHAIELARQGLSAEQLIRTVGITRGEAELLVTLHQKEAA